MRIEQIPKSILCWPLVAQWFLLAAWHRSLTLPSTVNQGIETGGLAGESKSACLTKISPDFAPWIACWRLVLPGCDPAEIRREAGIEFPLIAKPDIGWCGYGVRRVDDATALLAYAAAFPAGAAFMIQDLVATPGEAGVFYVRQPDAARGQVTGLTLRQPPSVTGDGRRTVRALVAANERLRGHAALYASALGETAIQAVPGAGAVVVLSTIASIRIGGVYEDATQHVTPALEAAIDSIARSMGGFHFGRFDVRFDTMADLLGGKFRIIEVNGAGSEAIHLWDPALSIRAAFAGVFAKQRLLFTLGEAMRRRGYAPVGVVGLARAWLRQRSLIRRYPAST